ncbi:MAG: SDR family oxidoreductase [Bryobacteraceae bacterium]|jgi:NAD(P)-dependent dehydrogenase (short-subunit alcohol dehydrogenase family)
MAEKSIENKVAIVTGGTRGIGRAIAGRLLDEGVRVAVCGTRQKSVDDAVEDLSGRDLSRKGRVFGMVADVSRLENVREFIGAVQQKFGAIHILINNAGSGTFASVAELMPEVWEKTIALNLTGAYYCCHEIMPIFKQAGGGDVVNIGSLAGVSAFAGGACYNASKFGLVGFSEAMMLDHRDDGVRVSLVMPGSVDTEFGGQADSEAAGRPRSKSEWKIAPGDIADIVVCMLRMPGRTTVSRVDIRPSRPPRKT